MSGKRKKHALAGAFSALIGLLCAAVLGVLFYGTMVYQLAGEQGAQARAQARLSESPAPLAQGVPASSLFPGALLALDSELATETGAAAQDVRVGGQSCRVITRSYELADGSQAIAISAAPAAYLERLAEADVRMQLITGFVLAGMDALYATRGDTAILAARDGDFVYMIEAQANEQALYALGAGASLETP